MFMIDHDFYTFKLNRNEPFENAYKLAYQAYIQGGTYSLSLVNF